MDPTNQNHASARSELRDQNEVFPQGIDFSDPERSSVASAFRDNGEH